MSFKDFFYFRRGEQVAVTLLLVLIAVAILLNITVCTRISRDTTLLQDEAAMEKIVAFRESLVVAEEFAAERDDAHQVPQQVTRPPSAERTIAERPSAERRTENRVENRNVERSSAFVRNEKLAVGETIFLNSTDTTEWKKIPGIGSVFADRIVRYKNRLGGFASVDQLREVNGINDELFAQIKPFIAHQSNVTQLRVNEKEFRELLAHPYLEYEQVRAVMNLRRRVGTISSIENLAMLSEFSDHCIDRLRPYLAF